MAMAVEAISQSSQALALVEGLPPAKNIRYRLRNVTFSKALVLEESSKDATIMLTLALVPGIKGGWHEFKISSLAEDIVERA